MSEVTSIPPTAKSTGESTTSDDATTESEAPKEEEWLDILGNGLLKKKIIKRGKGKRGKPGDLVTICYEGKLQDGTLVDKHNQIEFLLCDEDVIQAIDLAVILMEDGEKALVYTDARYAYGIHGKKPKIASNSHLTYEIEVLSVKPGPDFSTFTPKEKVAYADKKRNRGNQFFWAGDYIASINAYKRGLKQLENSGEKSVVDLRCKLLNNLSASQLKNEEFGAALISLDAVLKVEPKNAKALFRKGKCLEGLGKDEEAFECLRDANALDPQNTLISHDLAKIKSRLSASQKKEKEMYGKKFQQNKQENTTSNETPSATAISEQSPVKSDIPSTVSGSVSTTSDDATTESVAPKEEEWLDILGNGLLKKKIIKRGKGKRGKPGDLVTIYYEGKLQDGTLVDEPNQSEFLLCDEDVIQAFDLSVTLMEDGEKALVYTDARYAYGIHGKKPKIASNSHLTYEIEVLSVKPMPDFSTFTPKDKVAYADKKRDRGNQFYRAGDYIASINAYKRGLKQLEISGEKRVVDMSTLHTPKDKVAYADEKRDRGNLFDLAGDYIASINVNRKSGQKQLENSGEKSVVDMRCKLLNNLSASQLKKEEFGAALKSLDDVLSVEPKNTKALFRKGKCLEGLGKDEKAFECLRDANALLDPKNTLISHDLAKIKSRLSASQKKEKEMYGKMFQLNKRGNTTSNEPSPSPDMIGSTVVAAVGVLTGLWWFRKTS